MARRQSTTRAQIDWANLLVGVVAWVGIIQFAACVYIAIERYPSDRGPRYSLWQNFFSDLGCTVTENGQDNSSSSEIFNWSVVALGLLLIPFLLQLPANWERGRTSMRVTGIVSATGLIGIGLTPYDQYFIAHHVALGLWLVPLLVIVIAHYAAMFLGGRATNGLFLAMGFLLLAMLGYAAAGSHSGYVIFQKITAFFTMCWFAVVFANLGFVTVQALPNRRLIAINRQARRYLEKIEGGYRRRKDR